MHMLYISRSENYYNYVAIIIITMINNDKLITNGLGKLRQMWKQAREERHIIMEKKFQDPAGI